MELNPEPITTELRIVSYAPGKIQVNEQIYTQSCMIYLNQVISPWLESSAKSLQAKDLCVLLTLQPRPEIILLGVGETLFFPPAEIFAEIYEAQIGIEVMTTRAACRTYNLLSSDGRNVAAALF